jgi:hypothetical protein
MLSESEEAFIADLDLPSLRKTAEQIAQPRFDLAAYMLEFFDDVPADCCGTRVALGQEVAKAGDMASIARLLRALEADPGGTLSALGRAFIADEGHVRPRAAVTHLRAVPTPGPPRPGIFARAMAILGRGDSSPSPVAKRDAA